MAGVDIRRVEPGEDGFVGFFATGASAAGEFRCSECGYGIVCRRALPVCPMCHGSSWEQAPWRPLTRAREEQH